MAPQLPANPHALDRAALLAALDTVEAGLSGAEAARRLSQFGPNELPRKKAAPFWLVYARQFLSPLVYILVGAAVLSVVLGDLTDAGFIGVVLLLNALIGGIQEFKAERANRALQRLIQTRATVLRDTQARDVPAAELAPGDVVWLESGNRVPADLRLLSAHSLEVDESLLTGESLAVLKDADAVVAADAPVADRRNMCHAGAVVSRGRGKAVVVATGLRTAVGQLALDVSAGPEGKPPLLVRMERFSRLLGIWTLAACGAVALGGVLLRGLPVGEMVLFAVALAVSAIPEGLPVAMTVALAVATTRMARRGVVVRKLAAVEGLGSCTLIASDKTGTLTCNELTVRVAVLPDGARLDVSGAGYTPEGGISGAPDNDAVRSLARAVVLCNEGALHKAEGGWRWRGDPTDVALLAFGLKAGLVREEVADQFPQFNEIPFEPEHKFAATYHRKRGDGTVAFVKGAPERVLDMCRWADPAEHARAAGQAAGLAAQGCRVLAVAEGDDVPGSEDSAPQPPAGLTFLGLVGMMDPLRPGAREAVAACRDAGVQVAMVTGDHPVTALAISRELGLAQQADEVMTGTQVEALDRDGLVAALRRVRVFARTSPQQKLKLVEAARAGGHFVAVTGDGVNDAPAIHAANIGVAMGKGGTDVAREAAELVISDDNFATIVAGVEEGRVAYDNVRKVVYMVVSTGAGEVVLMALAVLAGMPLPLLPVQLLWLNLVTNGIQDVALAFEPKEADVLKRRPRDPGERLFNRLMIERTLVAALLMGALGMGWFWWLLSQGLSETAARNALLLLFVLFENVHIGNSRSETISLFRLSPLRNRILLLGVALATVLHVTAMYLPGLQGVLHTAPLGVREWLGALLLALALPAVMELHKLLRRRS
ncbi:MAG: HAD-IC family P-type ATPase [Planctomycetes bacterium]|nr:HAD-IC family P-type ATPase [Planctomycetota bacterium]